MRTQLRWRTLLFFFSFFGRPNSLSFSFPSLARSSSLALSLSPAPSPSRAPPPPAGHPLFNPLPPTTAGNHGQVSVAGHGGKEGRHTTLCTFGIFSLSFPLFQSGPAQCQNGTHTYGKPRRDHKYHKRTQPQV